MQAGVGVEFIRSQKGQKDNIFVPSIIIREQDYYYSNMVIEKDKVNERN